MTNPITTIEDLQRQILDIKNLMENFEFDENDYIDAYDEILDESKITIGYIEFLGSDILKQCDPVAYRYGLNDYASNQDKEDDEHYQRLEQELEELADELADLENKSI